MKVCLSVTAGFAGSRRRAHPDPGPDGEERQHERIAGQRQRLAQQRPAPRQSSAARDPTEGLRLRRGGL